MLNVECSPIAPLAWSRVDIPPQFGKLRADMRRLIALPGITFALFFAWKVGLLLLTSQPVPANDAFFYDGPVVNYLLHGKYCNPSLAIVLPISGTEVFSAYPPLHQFAMLGWMSIAGTSALAAMWFHVLLLGIFALTVFATLRELRAPAAARPIFSNSPRPRSRQLVTDGVILTCSRKPSHSCG